MSTAFEQEVQAQRVQALARRAERADGPVRQLLEQRLARLRAGPEPATPAAPRRPAAPLAALLQHIAQSTALPLPQAGSAARAAPPELKAVREHRGTWSRLSVEQRIHQALAQVPPQAGPLNTQRLVHEALRTLRDLSPDYLHRLVTQVEALLWLEQLAQGSGPARKAGSRGG